MKKFNLYIAAAAAMMLTACSEENFDVQGEGFIALQTSINSDMEVVSRATTDELVASCRVWISSDKGLVRRYDALADVPASIPLVTGSYVAEAWAGDSVSASFDTRYFKGYQPFTVEAGQTAPVKLVCKIANVAVSVDYSEADGIDGFLKDFKMTVGHKKGSLVFAGREKRRGFFMMPSYSPDLTYTLEGTQIDGSQFNYSGTIEAAQPATEYHLKVKFEQKASDLGGAIFKIVVDKHEIEVESSIELIAPPMIEGYGYDLASTVMGSQGTIGRRSVYISSATKLKSVEVRSDIFNSIPELGGDDFEILALEDRGVQVLNAAGITFDNQYDADTDKSLLKLNFEDELLNSLADGEYAITIVATDVKGQSRTATMNIKVSDAPVVTLPYFEPLDPVYTTAVLRGQVNKDGVEEIGFNYRKVGDVDWTYVEGTVGSRSYDKGTEYYAELSDLSDGTEYEYRAVVDGYVSDVNVRFSTTAYPQLPNCGFEDWYGSAPMYIAPSSSNFFWDSGNHGSKTVGKDLTTPTTEYKHSGKYGAKLQTMAIVGTIAAGNCFTGQFLGTENVTKGILGLGRPFDFPVNPKALKVWAKYEPQTLTSDYSNCPLKKGDLDQAQIYVALVDDSQTSYKTYSWPCIVRTADLTNYSFKKTGANVIGYGEVVFTEATAGNNLIEVTIPIEYLREGVKPTNVIIVAAASRYGDYYAGAANTILYLDDFEFVY